MLAIFTRFYILCVFVLQILWFCRSRSGQGHLPIRHLDEKPVTWALCLTRIKILQFLCNGGSKGGEGRPLELHILSISCIFWEILTKSYVGAPPPSRVLASRPRGTPGSATAMVTLPMDRHDWKHYLPATSLAGIKNVAETKRLGYRTLCPAYWENSSRLALAGFPSSYI